MFKYTLDNKRYHTLNYYYQNKYGCKVFKVSLNAGFSCPNIDGTKGYGGCIYCSHGSGDYYEEKTDLLTQFNEVKERLHKKWPKAKYIGYFQANTNTYAPLSELKKKYELILKQDNVVGLNIATRPDSISDEALEYLEELNKRTDLVIELGLQTIHNKTAKLINRGSTLEEFEDCLEKLNKRNIDVVVHIINGLPYETKEMMIETAKYLSNKKILGIKIHMLHILKDTNLLKLYIKENFHVLTKEEYVDIVCDQLEYLNENIVINRITGDPDKDELIEPTWLIKKFGVLNNIDKELVKRNTYQGFNRSILNRVKQIEENTLKSNDLVVDMTIGNGNDTLFLCNLVNKGHVFGFDVQKSAIDNTTKLLNENDFTNYTLFNESHENINRILNKYIGKISLILFNLGYLPGGDKSITTNHKSTLNALKNSFKMINNKGIILIVLYSHKEGKKEEIEIKKYLIENNIDYNEFHNTDNTNSPFLIQIKRK
ncbi:MAG: TIGR01212 family radical SAM protein [Bacilli bacterium]|nr:TIGR01212 family radical SAM protein [Bacilli bacterium]